MNNKVTNIIIAGLGGQGVIKASDILAEVAFRAGADVKKSEVHGMSQRGGSVASDVRIGAKVLSPMVPPGECDILVILDPTQVENNRHHLRAGGVLLEPSMIDESKVANKKSMNVVMMGALSKHIPEFSEDAWREAVKANLPEKLHAVNMDAFSVGRDAVK
jgi:indolepyruvate ferredoxin oxidoreductase beta subunit